MIANARNLEDRLAEETPKKERVTLYLTRSTYDAFRARFPKTSKAIELLMDDALIGTTPTKSIKKT
jgi:hypothetical protein